MVQILWLSLVMEVANPQLAEGFSLPQLRCLEKNGFFLTPSRHEQLYEVYESAERQSIPILVTADCLLHTFHILANYALRTTELEYLFGILDSLTRDLVEYEAGELTRVSSPGLREAIRRNLAFFSVGARLLNPDFPIPAGVSGLVESELEKIERHEGFDSSEIFGYLEDYSQYIPRGHYTRNEQFKRYFKAMIWYGRMGFYLRPGRGEEARELGRAQTRQALLICDALRKIPEGFKRWARVYEPTVFFVGRADDLTVEDYSRLIDETLGWEDLYSVIESDELLDRFIERATRLPAPRILSGWLPDTLRREEATQGFRFLGQRFIPDSYIFQELTYNRVGTQGFPRLFPKGLDVMAVLGSRRALQILMEVYHEDRFLNYSAQLERLKEEFTGLSEEEWDQNLYFGWLHLLKLLQEPVSAKGLPKFLYSPVWPDRCLVSSLGSWAELRHDTILYAKQSYTVGITAVVPEPAPAPAYLEPYPRVYSRISSLADKIHKTLSQQKTLHPEVGYKLEALKSLASRFAEISEKELRREPLEPEELRTLRYIGKTLKGLTTFSPEFKGQFLSQADERLSLIADVHTDPNTKQVLQVGVGDPNLIYAIIPGHGKTWIAQGACLSYYEFLNPLSQRLTDEEWQALWPKPPLESWMEKVVIP